MINLPGEFHEVMTTGTSNYYSLAIVLDDSLLDARILAEYLNKHNIVP